VFSSISKLEKRNVQIPTLEGFSLVIDQHGRMSVS